MLNYKFINRINNQLLRIRLNAAVIMMYHDVWYMMIGEVINNLIEGLCERNEHLDIFLFPPIAQ